MIEVSIVLALLSIAFDLVSHRVDWAVIWANELSILLLAAAACVWVIGLFA